MPRNSHNKSIQFNPQDILKLAIMLSIFENAVSRLQIPKQTSFIVAKGSKISANLVEKKFFNEKLLLNGLQKTSELALKTWNNVPLVPKISIGFSAIASVFLYQIYEVEIKFFLLKIRSNIVEKFNNLFVEWKFQADKALILKLKDELKTQTQRYIKNEKELEQVMHLNEVDKLKQKSNPTKVELNETRISIQHELAKKNDTLSKGLETLMSLEKTAKLILPQKIALQKKQHEIIKLNAQHNYKLKVFKKLKNEFDIKNASYTTIQQEHNNLSSLARELEEDKKTQNDNIASLKLNAQKKSIKLLESDLQEDQEKLANLTKAYNKNNIKITAKKNELTAAQKTMDKIAGKMKKAEAYEKKVKDFLDAANSNLSTQNETLTNTINIFKTLEISRSTKLVEIEEAKVTKALEGKNQALQNSTNKTTTPVEIKTVKITPAPALLEKTAVTTEPASVETTQATKVEESTNIYTIVGLALSGLSIAIVYQYNQFLQLRFLEITLPTKKVPAGEKLSNHYKPLLSKLILYYEKHNLNKSELKHYKEFYRKKYDFSHAYENKTLDTLFSSNKTSQDKYSQSKLLLLDTDYTITEGSNTKSLLHIAIKAYIKTTDQKNRISPNNIKLILDECPKDKLDSFLKLKYKITTAEATKWFASNDIQGTFSAIELALLAWNKIKVDKDNAAGGEIKVNKDNAAGDEKYKQLKKIITIIDLEQKYLQTQAEDYQEDNLPNKNDFIEIIGYFNCDN